MTSVTPLRARSRLVKRIRSLVAFCDLNVAEFHWLPAGSSGWRWTSVNRLPLFAVPNLEVVLDWSLDAASVVVDGEVDFVEFHRLAKVDF